MSTKGKLEVVPSKEIFPVRTDILRIIHATESSASKVLDQDMGKIRPGTRES